VTYCVAIKVRDGLIALADGRLTSGTQVSAARKLTLHGPAGAQFMIMCSGLRSVRDKTLTYFEQTMHRLEGGSFHTLFEAVSTYCEALRRVRQEDAEALESSSLKFNLHAIMGGRLPGDAEPDLFMVYPEGNWIKVDQRTPYLSIGATTYGKPILDRALSYDAEMRHALRLAYLSFDSTRYSSSDVGFPIDLMSFTAADGGWRSLSFEYEDLIEQRQWWNQHITEIARRLPDHPWLGLLPGDEAGFGGRR
jgi:putative proteasome-type protease